ncbi:MAG: DUF547 domain-containing protein [Saprospiraceae bacterium]|nr:DUF547 domain-containing protein [Saprospiraceae bacterium]
MLNILIFALLYFCQGSPTQVEEVNPWVRCSMDYLELLKDRNDVSDVLNTLKEAEMRDLAESLETKEEKLAFWINIYNAHVITLLLEDPTYFEDKDVFFKERDINIAGINMSLDEIEHGILRDSRIKWSLGYLQKWFEPDWIRILRNEEVDARIHFALNCGAVDCPPVGIYNDLEVNSQLDKMTTRYLNKKTTVEGDKVTTTPLFSWFRADFGGKNGIKEFLVRFDIIEDSDVDLSFSDYDWTMQIGEIRAI